MSAFCFERVERLCLENGISLDKMAKNIGLSGAAASRWRHGAVPYKSTIKAIADYFGVPIDYILVPENENTESLFEKYGIRPMPSTRKVPLIGTIACGNPILAVENQNEEVDMPEHIRADFALLCKGDSMINARIHDGDIAYIREQPAVENGQIAAVVIEDEVTLKRVYLSEDQIMLVAENPKYQPLVYHGETMNSVRILGLAVAFTSVLE